MDETFGYLHDYLTKEPPFDVGPHPVHQLSPVADIKRVVRSGRPGLLARLVYGSASVGSCKSGRVAPPSSLLLIPSRSHNSIIRWRSPTFIPDSPSTRISSLSNVSQLARGPLSASALIPDLLNAVAILVGGFATADPTYHSFYPLGLLTLHVLGRNDTIVTPERGMTLVERCTNARLEMHDGGHFVPSKATWRHFFKWVVHGNGSWAGG